MHESCYVWIVLMGVSKVNRERNVHWVHIYWAYVA